MPHVKNQETYWDTVADDKKFTTPFQMELFTKYISPEKYILDVGCGYGRTLNELYQQGYKNLNGVDFSKKMIIRGQNLYPNLALKKNEKGVLPYKNQSFDAVILIAVLTCIISDTDQEKLMREIRRVLKNNGILYINDFLINTDDRNVRRYKKFAQKYHAHGIFELSEGAVLRHYSEMRINELTSGFETLEYRKTTYTTMNGNTSNGFYYFGKNCLNVRVK